VTSLNGGAWTRLLVLSALITLLLEWLGLPAALLLGPMLAAVACALRGDRARLHRLPVLFAQAVLGCMIARALPPSVLGRLLQDWPVYGLSIALVLGFSLLIGWLLTRRRLLPGTSAIWGTSPGAATAMTLMSEAYGADVRMVAIMQYLRVFCVAMAASLAARLTTGDVHAVGAAMDWFPPLDGVGLACTLGLMAAGLLLSRCLPISSGPIMLPLIGGILLQPLGWFQITLPPWLLAVSYAFIGWSIGLRFTREILLHAAKALPAILASILSLMVLCALLGLALARIAHVDGLTAFLATSPGGADSIAIIAASSPVDVSFVMTMQTARLLVVMALGPRLAQLMAARQIDAQP